MPKLTINQLMYRLRSYTTEIIALGGPLESNNFRSTLATVH